jgi:hypothetical protein
MITDKIRPHHFERKALLYVRQDATRDPDVEHAVERVPALLLGDERTCRRHRQTDVNDPYRMIVTGNQAWGAWDALACVCDHTRRD